MDTVDQETKDHRFVPISLNCTVFFLERTNECIRQVRSGELERYSETNAEEIVVNSQPHKSKGYLYVLGKSDIADISVRRHTYEVLKVIVSTVFAFEDKGDLQ